VVPLAELQYGERSQLDSLGAKELPVTGGMRQARPAGRPAGSISGQAPTAPVAAEAEYDVPEDQRFLMSDFFETEKALRTARTYLAMPGAGAWAQLMYAAALQSRDTAAAKLKVGTPDWEIG